MTSREISFHASVNAFFRDRILLIFSSLQLDFLQEQSLNTVVHNNVVWTFRWPLMRLDKIWNVLPEPGKSVISSVCLSTSQLPDPRFFKHYLLDVFKYLTHLLFKKKLDSLSFSFCYIFSFTKLKNLCWVPCSIRFYSLRSVCALPRQSLRRLFASSNLARSIFARHCYRGFNSAQLFAILIFCKLFFKFESGTLQIADIV